MTNQDTYLFRPSLAPTFELKVDPTTSEEEAMDVEILSPRLFPFLSSRW